MFVCSLNGPTWLPSNMSVICSEHFTEMKSVDDPSFLPRLFPSEIVGDRSAEPRSENKNELCDFSVLKNIVDRMPTLSAVDQGSRSGLCHRRTDTSQLQEAFRELASHVCRLLVAHDSELLIEGTVGVTVDGGARVMLLHFADQVRKSEPLTAEENTENPVCEGMFDCVTKNDAKDPKRVQTGICSPEDEITAVGNADCDVKVSPFAASSGLSKVLSDLAQKTTNASFTSPGAQRDPPVGLSAQKRKIVTDSNSFCDKTKPQTLLRELLCSPLPPKRPNRPVNSAAATTAAPNIPGKVVSRQTPAKSTVLSGLLQTSNYKHELNSSPVGNSIHGRDVRPMHQLGAVSQGSYGGSPHGFDIHGSQFGGNAVQALLRLANEHAATGRHDLMRSGNRRESSVPRNDSFDRLTDVSVDRRFSSMVYRNLVGSDHGSTSSQNSTRSDWSTATNSVSESGALSVKQEGLGNIPEAESAALNVKQEILDPDYDSLFTAV